MVCKDSENDDPKALLRRLKNTVFDTDWHCILENSELTKYSKTNMNIIIKLILI